MSKKKDDGNDKEILDHSGEDAENMEKTEKLESQIDSNKAVGLENVVGSEYAPNQELHFPDVVIPKYGEIVVPAGKKSVEMHFKNPVENEGKYDLMYTLSLVDAEGNAEVLCRTQSIVPGEDYVHKQMLRGLKKGVYEARLSIAVNSEDLTVMATDVFYMPITVRSVFVFPWLILIVCLAGALLVGAVCWYAFVPKSEEAQQALTSLGLDPNLGREADTSSQEGGQIAISGFSSLTIPPNTKDINVNLINPEVNKGKYDFTFKLYLEDTGEVLYQSGLVPGGEKLNRITLERGLPEGEYNAVVFVQPYDTNDKTRQLNNMTIPVKLTVE